MLPVYKHTALGVNYRNVEQLLPSYLQDKMRHRSLISEQTESL